MTTPRYTELADQISVLTAKATPPPWQHRPPMNMDGTVQRVVAYEDNWTLLSMDSGYSERASWDRRYADAALIAYLRSQADELAAALRHAADLEQEVAELRGRLAEWDERLAERRHEIEFRDDGWTIAHPLHERVDGSLFNCPRTWSDDDPAVRGRFYLENDGSVGAAVDQTGAAT